MASQNRKAKGRALCGLCCRSVLPGATSTVLLVVRTPVKHREPVQGPEPALEAISIALESLPWQPVEIRSFMFIPKEVEHAIPGHAQY